MSDRDPNACRAQLFDQRRDAQVGAGDGLAAGVQDTRDCAHSDAADSDEVIPHCLLLRESKASTRATIALTGSPVPRRAAAWERACRRGGSTVFVSNADRPPACSSRSFSSTAAPAPANRAAFASW